MANAVTEVEDSMANVTINPSSLGASNSRNGGSFFDFLCGQPLPTQAKKDKNWLVRYPEYNIFYFNHHILKIPDFFQGPLPGHTLEFSSKMTFHENPDVIPELDHKFKCNWGNNWETQYDVAKYVYCQGGHLAAVKKSNRDKEIQVLFLRADLNVLPLFADKLKDQARDTDLSVCAHNDHIIVAYTSDTDDESRIKVFDYETGQPIHNGSLQGIDSLPYSNAVCLADESGSFFVAGANPITLSLYSFDNSEKNYRPERMIGTEELGMGRDFGLYCRGISSKIQKIGGEMTTILCIALGDKTTYFHSLRFYKVHILRSSDPLSKLEL